MTSLDSTTVVRNIGALISGAIDLTKFTVVRRSLVTGKVVPATSIFTNFRTEDERVEAENFVLEVIPREREIPTLFPA